MFETLYTRPTAIARHRSEPLAVERQRFLEHRAKQGLARGTLRLIACELLVIVRRMRIDRGKRSVTQIEVAAENWARSQRRRKRARALRSSRKAFRATAIDWLSFLGRLKQSQAKRSRYAKLIEPFEAFMRDERGLSDATIRRCCWHAEKFLDYLRASGRCLKKVCVEWVDAYLARKGTEG